MLTCKSGQQYGSLESLCHGELAAGRMSQGEFDQLTAAIPQIEAAVNAFDWTQLLSIIGNIAPLIATFVPGLQWVAIVVPALAGVLQIIQSGGSAQQLLDAIKAAIQKLIPHINPTPTPNPAPAPGPLPTPSA